MGGYDLNGRYYPNVEDAINADLAQCAEIDNRNNQKAMRTYEKQSYEQGQIYGQYIEDLQNQINELKERLTKAGF